MKTIHNARFMIHDSCTRIVHRALCIVNFVIFILIHSSFGQGGTWTWISGDTNTYSAGVYGTQGVASVNNHPPGMYEPCEWKDKDGNFWLYGGTYPAYSDLWRFNPSTLEWTWMMGNGLVNESPVGVKGQTASTNTPGRRDFAAATWVDTTGNLWLFSGGARFTNDLWEYDIGTNQWTWVSGTQINQARSVYKIKDEADTANIPGGRQETASGWTDSDNNLWLFGGLGYIASAAGSLNDLWKYSIDSNEWALMKGDTFTYTPAVYGTIGSEDVNNDPGGRWTYTRWKDKDGNLWFMGGWGVYGYRNDVWKYNLSTDNWVWMSGTSQDYDTGWYNMKCVYNNFNLPRARREQRAAVTDFCGKFWMFGGDADDYANDLWIFDPETLQWKWISGNVAPNQFNVYGQLGVPSSTNTPGDRMGSVAWWGNDNKFYMFGGYSNFSTGLSDLWRFDPDTSCITVCNSAAVLPPAANFQSDTTTVCANACINFTNLSTNATSWQWHFAGALDSTSTAQNPQNICYSKAGIYNVTLIAINTAGSDTVTFSNYITVAPTPPMPVITQHQDHDTLYCSFDTSYYKYQWFLDSALIAGATDTFLVISTSGNYNVQVTNKNGCSIAGGINVVLGVENYVNDNVVYIYPNPAGNKFTVYGLQFTVGRMEIYNIVGQETSPKESGVLRTPPAPLQGRGGSAAIDVSSLSSGIYFVRVVSESGIWVGKFVKE